MYISKHEMRTTLHTVYVSMHSSCVPFLLDMSDGLCSFFDRQQWDMTANLCNNARSSINVAINQRVVWQFCQNAKNNSILPCRWLLDMSLTGRLNPALKIGTKLWKLSVFFHKEQFFLVNKFSCDTASVSYENMASLFFEVLMYHLSVL